MKHPTLSQLFQPAQLTPFRFMNKEEKRESEGLLRAARAKSRKCMYPGCNELAISSHILQKKGILDVIAEDGHVMQLSVGGPLHGLRFKKKGIGVADMLTFNGFCSVNKHDMDVFREIENIPCDFTNYRHQLLLLYRAKLNELFKQYFMIDYFNSIISSPKFSRAVKVDYINFRYEMLWRLKNSEYFKSLIENELFSEGLSRKFTFYRFELPKLEVATSAVTGFSAKLLEMSYEDALSYDPMLLAGIADELSVININLIPTQNSLLFILGCSEAVTSVGHTPLSKINNLSAYEMAKVISDLLIQYVETWCVSILLFNKLNFQDKIEQALRIKLMVQAKRSLKLIDTKFNLFEAAF
jgi:hypothetical protein